MNEMIKVLILIAVILMSGGYLISNVMAAAEAAAGSETVKALRARAN
jgi:hypothetical protein